MSTIFWSSLINESYEPALEKMSPFACNDVIMRSNLEKIQITAPIIKANTYTRKMIYYCVLDRRFLYDLDTERYYAGYKAG